MRSSRPRIFEQPVQPIVAKVSTAMLVDGDRTTGELTRNDANVGGGEAKPVSVLLV
jgi:hypothetical protein